MRGAGAPRLEWGGRRADSVRMNAVVGSAAVQAQFLAQLSTKVAETTAKVAEQQGEQVVALLQQAAQAAVPPAATPAAPGRLDVTG